MLLVDGLGTLDLRVPRARRKVYKTVFPVSTPTFLYIFHSLLRPEEHGFYAPTARVHKAARVKRANAVQEVDRHLGAAALQRTRAPTLHKMLSSIRVTPQPRMQWQSHGQGPNSSRAQCEPGATRFSGMLLEGDEAGVDHGHC